jgi:hypothetical protein
MRSPEYRFRPRPTSLKQYERAAQEFLGKYSQHPDVLGIYQFGTVNNPGISDLDFIVVVKERLSEPLTRDYGYDFFSEKTSYILSHNPLIVPENLFSELGKIYPILGDLRTHYGQEWLPTYESPASRVYTALSLMIVCFRYPRQFISMRTTEFLDVRLSLQVLNALRHTRLLAQKLNLPTYEAEGEFFQQIMQLQRDWFELPASQAVTCLEKLMQDAARLSARLIQDLAGYVEKHFLQSNHRDRKQSPKLVGRYKPDSILFVTLEPQHDLLELINSVWTRTGELMGVLPEEFLIPLRAYIDNPGDTGSWVRQNLYLSHGQTGSGSSELHQAARDTASSFERLYSFYRKNPIDLAMYPNPFRFSLEFATQKDPSHHSILGPLSTLARTYIRGARLKRAGIQAGTGVQL